MPSKSTDFLTLWTGLSAEGNKVLRAQLSDVAAECGYVTDRGPATGQGSIRELLADLADGVLAVMEVDEERDPRLVAWLRDQAAQAEQDTDLADQLQGIAACIERALARRRRRNREEMDALSAEPNSP